MNRYNELMGGTEGSTIDDSSSDDQGFDQPKELIYDMKNFDTLMNEITF